MKNLVQFPLEDGSGVVYVEVDETTSGYERVATEPGEVAGAAAHTFEQALAPLRPAVTALIERFQALAVAPDQVQVHFGIKLTGKAGAVFASAQTEGQLQVTLTWTSTRPEEGDEPEAAPRQA